MVRVALCVLWFRSMRPGSRGTSLGSEFISCFQNQLTLPWSTMWHFISTMEPRFLATKRGYCQIWEQGLPVDAKAWIKILPGDPLTASPTMDPYPGWHILLAQPPGLSLLFRLWDNHEAEVWGSGAM